MPRYEWTGGPNILGALDPGVQVSAGGPTILRHRSKTYTTIADPGSKSGSTFQSMQFFAVFIYFPYLSYLGHPSLLGLHTKTKR